MEYTTITEAGKDQIITLPNGFGCPGDEVIIHKIGKAMILVPKERRWETFLNGLTGFTDDFMSGGRNDEILSERLYSL